jgi:hypothetical protein
MSSNLTFLESFFEGSQGNTVQYLTDNPMVDMGPVEPRHSDYVDAAILQEHCLNCKHRIMERQQARVHKPQTFWRL